MRRSHSYRVVLVLFLVTALGTPPVWGQPARSEVTSAFSLALDVIVGLWGDAGCIIDPYGACAAIPSTSAADEGCGIDPYGGCFALEEGCGLDPHGGCPGIHTTPSTDAGCVIDPHGGCSN